MLNLPDTTPTNDGQTANSPAWQRRSDPPYCYLENRQLKFNTGANTGNCRTLDRCICRGDYPPPPLPSPPPPPHPPGQGNYQLIEQGTCADPVLTIGECRRAAAVLGLIGQVRNDNQGASHPQAANDPPYCYLEGWPRYQLKFNGGTNTGDCAGSGSLRNLDRCICRQTMPPPPEPEPSPPPPPSPHPPEPPPPPPPSPSPPEPGAQTRQQVVSFTTTLSYSTPEAFLGAPAESYKTNLANFLGGGITAADITLIITSGSVIVEARITPRATMTANAITTLLTPLAASTSAAASWRCQRR